MKNFTLGLIVAFVLSAGFAYADTVQQIQSPIYKDDIGRSHFLGKGGYSTTRHIQMQEAGAAAINDFAEKQVKEEVKSVVEESKKEAELKVDTKKETNIMDVIQEKESTSVIKKSKATFTPEAKNMDASAPFGRGMTNIPAPKVNDSKTMYTDDIGRLHFFGKANIVKE